MRVAVDRGNPFLLGQIITQASYIAIAGNVLFFLATKLAACYSSVMDALSKSTVTDLVKRLVWLHRRTEDMKQEYARIEDEKAAIRRLVPQDVFETAIKEIVQEEVAKNQQPKPAAQPAVLTGPASTLRERIVACLGRLGVPSTPSEIVSGMAGESFEDRKSLSAKVNTELRRMLKRQPKEIERLPKAKYQLLQNNPGQHVAGRSLPAGPS